ncbi:MAG: DUF3667 domain-containing protein [Chitinophagaceae bacterium]|jgi:hypothetical protein|nr:DUF3667 domain-containing protein [Chitinophagaceae bacterium]
MSAPIRCKNCNTHFKGNFCPHCGQAATIERIDYHYFIHDIPHSVFHVDKGFFYTLKWMFINPGLAIKEYLEGKRIRHFRPFGFVVILSTICTLLIPWIEKAIVYTLQKTTGNSFIFKQLFWEKYISLLIFLLIPILALVTFLTFKNRKYNYWEHFLGNTYLAALLNVLLVFYKLFGLAKVFLGLGYSINIAAFMFIYMFYYSYAFRKWMAPTTGFWPMFFRLLLMNFLLSFIYITVLSVTGIITPWWNF